MGGACRSNVGIEKCIGKGDVRKRDQLEDTGVDGKIT